MLLFRIEACFFLLRPSTCSGRRAELFYEYETCRLTQGGRSHCCTHVGARDGGGAGQQILVRLQPGSRCASIASVGSSIASVINNTTICVQQVSTGRENLVFNNSSWLVSCYILSRLPHLFIHKSLFRSILPDRIVCWRMFYRGFFQILCLLLSVHDLFFIACWYLCGFTQGWCSNSWTHVGVLHGHRYTRIWVNTSVLVGSQYGGCFYELLFISCCLTALCWMIVTSFVGFYIY